MEVETYRARIRFRVAKQLNVADSKYPFKVAGQEALMQSPTEGTSIHDSEWLVINTRGFADDADARIFGRNLQASLHLASAVTRLGLDPGQDLPTSGLAQHVKQHIAEKTGAKVRDNVHGLDVFVDDPNVTIFNFQATGVVRVNPDPFLSLTAELHGVVEGMSEEARDIVLLLNFALMRPEPVAKIIFCISAVEMLGQEEHWSDAQKAMLKQLANSVQAIAVGSEQERSEVADAIKRGLHRLSLRQGVLRLLDRLNLSHLRRSWDAIYGERSRLVHGLAPVPGARYEDLADRTVSLCGQILLTRVAQEVPAIKKHINAFYLSLPRKVFGSQGLAPWINWTSAIWTGPSIELSAATDSNRCRANDQKLNGR